MNNSIQKYLIQFCCSCLCISLNSNIHCQIQHPFPTSNAMWSEYYQPPYHISPTPIPIINALFEEDTIINDLTYSKLYQLSDTVDVLNNRKYVGGIRCDTASKVYFLPDYVSDEFLIYDFDVEVGDSIYSKPVDYIGWFYPNPLVVTLIDTIEMLNQCRKRIHFQRYCDTPWIEGIGSLRGLLFKSGYIPSNGIWGELICFFDNGNLIYHNPEFETCYPLPLDDVPDPKDFGDTFLKLYPNPSVNETIIEITTGEIERIDILDITGRKVFLRTNINSNKITLNTAQFKEGLYYLRVEMTDKKQQHKTFVVVR